MRAVVQRVTRASVSVGGETIAEISSGLCVLVGAETGDADADVRWIAEKIATLRIFSDDEGKMNRDVIEAGGSALVVSQFTLLGDVRRGRRPGFTAAAPPEQADQLILAVGDTLEQRGLSVARGRFRADMAVSLVNDGPVTILLDSRKTF